MTTYEIGMTLERKRIALGMSRRYVQEKTGLGKSKIAGVLNDRRRTPGSTRYFYSARYLAAPSGSGSKTIRRSPTTLQPWGT